LTPCRCRSNWRRFSARPLVHPEEGDQPDPGRDTVDANRPAGILNLRRFSGVDRIGAQA
jgi:hypothetical protein